MGKVVYYEESKVAAKSVILAKLREIANRNGMSETEILGDFIQDLRNWNKDGYQYKVEKFIEEIDDSVREDLIVKLSKDLKLLQKIEKTRKKKEERQPQKEEKERKEKEERVKQYEEKMEQERKAKFDKYWNEICEIVSKQSEGSSKPEYVFWEDVKKIKFPSISNQKLSGIQSKVRQKLEDEIYYQKVKFFTFDFEFLSQFYESARGTSVRRKIDDKRYFALRDEMHKYQSERNAIHTMLKNPNTDEVTKRILQSRLQQMQKNNEYER